MAVDGIVLITIDVRRCRRLDVVEIYHLIDLVQQQVRACVQTLVDERPQSDRSIQLVAACSDTEAQERLLELQEPQEPQEPCSQQRQDDLDESTELNRTSQGTIVAPGRAQTFDGVGPSSLKSWLCSHHEVANLAGWSLLNILEENDASSAGPTDQAAMLSYHEGEDLVIECRTALASSVRGRNRLQIHVLLIALRCVAVSFRRLDPKELFDAVMTAVAGDHNVAVSRSLGVEDSQDLMSLCSNLLIVRDDGDVDFFRRPMKQLMLDSEPLGKLSGHETMSQICLRQIKRVLQPWKDIISLVAEYAAHPFLRYARRYWQDHYGVGETVDNDLPARLLHIIELEITEFLEEGFLSIEIHRMTVDLGLDLALKNRWEALQRICEQMGAVLGRTALPGTGSASTDDLACLFERLRKPKPGPQPDSIWSNSWIDHDVSWKICCLDDVGANSGSPEVPFDADHWISISGNTEDLFSTPVPDHVESLSAGLQTLDMSEVGDKSSKGTPKHNFRPNDLRHNDPVQHASPHSQDFFDWEVVYRDEAGKLED